MGAHLRGGREPEWKTLIDGYAEDFIWDEETVTLWATIKAADRPEQIRLLEEATGRAKLTERCFLLEGLRGE